MNIVHNNLKPKNDQGIIVWWMFCIRIGKKKHNPKLKNKDSRNGIFGLFCIEKDKEDKQIKLSKDQ